MDKVYYYNRNGQLKLTIGEDPYFMLLGKGEFKDHSFEYSQLFGQYKGFYRSKTAYPFSIVIRSDNLKDFDALCDIFNDDVLAEKPGYFLINGWKLDCYVIQAKHKFYGDRDHVIEFEALAVNSTWTRSTTKRYDGAPPIDISDFNFGRNYEYEDSVLGRGYEYGYEPFIVRADTIHLNGAGNGYEAVIYGPAVNPTFYINNKPVSVYVSLTASERLRIVSNGSIKTIDIINSDGSTTSAFVYRDKMASPFFSLGEINELSFGDLKLDFTAIERRSEPSWT